MTVTLRVASIATALGVAVGLTGCLPSATIPPTESPRASTPSTATETPLATPSVIPTPQKFVEACSTLLTAAQVYAFNPNYVVDSSYAPKPGTVSARIAADLGQTCGWINETSSVELEVAVAKPVPSAVAAARSAASTGTPITADGENGYFAVINGIGTAQFFIGSLWLSVASADFASANDAEAVYPVVVHNQLTAGG